VREGLRLDDPRDSLLSADDVLQAAGAWPEHVREAVRVALAAPSDWPVKRLAAMANVSRRTLERYFEDAGLPGPAAVLGRL
jgi:transcriptional regulator GlxA family with amidase domain